MFIFGEEIYNRNNTRQVIYHNYFFFFCGCARLLAWVCLFWNDGGRSQGQSITSLSSGFKNVRAASCVVHQHHLGESISTMLGCEERPLYTWFIDWWMLHREQHVLSIPPSLPSSILARLPVPKRQPTISYLTWKWNIHCPIAKCVSECRCYTCVNVKGFIDSMSAPMWKTQETSIGVKVWVFVCSSLSP